MSRSHQNLNFTRVLLGSFFIHILLVATARLAPEVPRDRSSSQIEIEVLGSRSRSPKGQVVRQPEIPKEYELKSTEDKLRFLSAQLQRVRKQVKALDSGMTANRSEQARPQTQASNGKSRRNSKLNRTLDPDEKAELGDKKLTDESASARAASNPFTDLPKGRSTIGEDLPQVTEVGSFTALNTDKYLFYSFYSRLEEMIRYSWENQVAQALNSTAALQLRRSLNERWNTEVEVTLRPNGEFIDAKILKESGFHYFDRAATQAFSRHRIFPNPPKEMVEEDGLIHIRYGFSVHVRPNALGRY